MTSENDFVLTFDIDWAPDFVIDYVANILIANKVKSTWFVTHNSDAIERLKARSDLFELGIHPNMLSGSTHGKTEDEVLNYILNIVPNAISMRTHSLYQSTGFLIKASKEYGILNDVSLFLPRAPHLQPHTVQWHGISLCRIPYFWEDASEMSEDNSIWDISDYRLKLKGLRILSFHPIHIALNTERFERYSDLKKIKPVQLWDRQFIEDNSYKGDGPQNLFLQVVQHLAGKGIMIKDIGNKQDSIKHTGFQ